MKALLINTTSIVAASLALGISTAANAQESTVQLTGEVSLGGTGFASDKDDDPDYLQDVWDQSGSFDVSFDIAAAAPEYGFGVFGHADLGAESSNTSFDDMNITLQSASIGVSGGSSALMARVGPRVTELAYAGDLAVGGAGATTKFLDEGDDSPSVFDSIEIIYAHAQGPLSVSAAYEPESGKISGAAGYDLVSMYGPGRINGYAFEDTMNNYEDTVDAIRGYRVAGFINNGAIELGGSIAVEDIDFADAHASGNEKSERFSYGLGAVLMVQDNLDISVDYEHTSTSIDDDDRVISTIFSFGAEISLGDTMSIGGHVKQFNNAPVDYLRETTDKKSGTEAGFDFSVSF